jgi:hypothetical protein
MSIFKTIGDTFDALWEKVKHIFHDDVEPAVKTFFSDFASAEGKLILTEGIEAAKQLAEGKPFGEVALELVTDLIAKSPAIAAQDAAKTLQQVQGALQIGKAANGIQSASDKELVATVEAGKAA